MTYRGDVRSLEDQQAAMSQAVDRFGSLDIVVANAGVGHAGPIESVTADELTPFADNAAVLGAIMPGAANPTFDDVSAAIASGGALGIRHHKPEDIGKAVMFFTGDATRQMTGDVLDVSYGSAATSVS